MTATPQGIRQAHPDLVGSSEPDLPWLGRRLLSVGERCTGRSLKLRRRTLMKLHQSIAVCLALMAGVAADGCFAQSATNQSESVAVGNAPQDPAVALPAVTPVPSMSLGRTREQVMRELED